MENEFVLGQASGENERDVIRHEQKQEQQKEQKQEYKCEGEKVFEAKEQLASSLRIALTLSPSKLQRNLLGLLRLAPTIQKQLLEKLVLPLQIQDAEPRFLKTEFNRNGDSYRSPFTNTYFPPIQGPAPIGELRWLEENGNTLFTEYTKLYYGADGLGTFFVSGLRPEAFSCAYFAKRVHQEEAQEGFLGGWNSFNVVEVRVQGANVTYHLKTTVLIQAKRQQTDRSLIELSGYLSAKQDTQRPLALKPMEGHLIVVGELIEEMETQMRRHLETVYVSKTKEVLFTTRYENTVGYQQERKKLAEGLKNIHLNK